ncbi:pyruvate kinase [Paenibacillus koleovorans]|uniref:pyruvate kinase n=1 Tax=Paenibacillus koleovorans TaxID=121608 RepID=UPI000FDC4676|nr:pyruvate kinase [Paenibacillus koleovorans]
MRKTKMVCTMGPACDQVETLKEMIACGMNVARINMAHGELEDHEGRMNRVRQAAKESGVVVPILMDIKGPEIRIGKLKEASYSLKTGDALTLTTDEVLGDAERLPVNYNELPKVIRPGNRILIDDGLIELHVENVEETEVHCRILNGGTIKPRKGVNLPGVKTTLPGVTERDIRHIAFGVEQRVDMIAMSFVRSANDVLQVRHLLEEHGAGHVQIISKIENMEGVENLDAILEASDGIMVARGDLGVEIPVEDVPLIQKRMIERCNVAGKPVIVATHMLDSMQVNPRPTRAEASDVANSVLEGTDAIMLSGETAAGRYPVESVRTMATIAMKAESMLASESGGGGVAGRRTTASAGGDSVTDVISRSAVDASRTLLAKAILTPTETGFTARMVSKHRPDAPIVAITADENVLSRLALVWGVYPVLGTVRESMDAMFRTVLDQSVKTGLVEKGDYVVITAGVPIGRTGATNLIQVQQV